MMRHGQRRAVLAAAVTAVGAAWLLAVPGRAARADDMVDSPRYAAWAKCKPGTAVTIAADMDMGQAGQAHLSVVRTLREVTADAATVSVATTMTMMGQDRPGGTRTETIAAKEPKASMTQTGTADVQAMGKTFKCKVYQGTGAAPAGPAGRPGTAGGPAGGNAAGPAGGSVGQATVYVSDDVPGGIVKMETAMGPGKTLTFVLTAIDAK